MMSVAALYPIMHLLSRVKFPNLKPEDRKAPGTEVTHMKAKQYETT